MGEYCGIWDVNVRRKVIIKNVFDREKRNTSTSRQKYSLSPFDHLGETVVIYFFFSLWKHQTKGLLLPREQSFEIEFPFCADTFAHCSFCIYYIHTF